MDIKQKERYDSPLIYERLGEEKEKVNINQAYLCYEQAHFYEKDTAKQIALRHKMQELSKKPDFCVVPMSVVILSYQDIKTTQNCITSIRKNENLSTLELIVVDNASTDGSAKWIAEDETIKGILNEENLGFPIACNQGIAVAEKENDILLLNNDTLVPANAFFWLRMGLYESKDTATAGSVSNHVANYQTIPEAYISDAQYEEYGAKYNVYKEYPYELKSWLIAFCALYKRSALENVGYLDEQFSPGNFEDNDLGTRLNQAGYVQRLCINSFVFHYGSKSFSKQKERFMHLFEENEKKYEAKWNYHPYKHTYIRMELLSFLPKEWNEKNSAKRILEVGCGAGATLGRLKRLYPGIDLIGVEPDEMCASIAQRISPVVAKDIFAVTVDEIGKFDYILLGGIFEHVLDGNALLEKVRTFLKPNGTILASCYNMTHISVLNEMMKGGFTYKADGILDREHIHFYGIEQFLELFLKQGFLVKNLSFQKKDLSAEEEELFKRLSSLNTTKDPNLYLAYQYVVEAQ